jgi:ribosomal protein S18 acetylase RimI-like enzyme
LGVWAIGASEVEGLVRRNRLSAGELAAIEALAAICRRHEGLELQLNFEILRTRPGTETNDFLYYAGGALVGFLELYGAEVEAIGMVHPEHRRRGVFTALLAAARAECRRRGLADLLLVCERVSAAGQAFVRATGATYRFSEYAMVWSGVLPPPVAPRLRLERIGPAGVPALARVTARAFDDPEERVRARFAREIADPERHSYLAWLGAQAIGGVNALFEEDGGAYIYAFAVLPEHRGRVHGREILARTIATLHAEGRTRIALEVETENRAALTLYTSCGFRETTVYDYFRLTTGA